MRTSPTRFFFTHLIITAAAGMILPLAGCDDSHTADKRVHQTLDEARLARFSGKNDEAQKLLEQAANDANAAAATKAHAKSVLAQAELDNALARMSDPNEGLDAKYRQISGLLSDINGMGHEIRTTNGLAAMYRQFEPKEARDAVQAKLAEANGGGAKMNWVGEGPTALPTLELAKQKVSQLQGEVSTKEAEIKQLQSAKQAKQTEAEQAARSAAATPGKQGITQFKIASGLRKQVADLQNQIEVAQARLAPVQQDLALAQAQQAGVAIAIDQFQRAGQQIDEGWKNVDQQILAQTQLAGAILRGGSAPNGAKTNDSIAKRAAELKAIVDKSKDQEKEIEEQLTASATHFEEAAGAARTLSTEARTTVAQLPRDNPMRKALDTVVEVYDPNGFLLGQANAKLTLATLLSSKAQTLNERLKVVTELGQILKEAGLPLPAEMQDGSLAADAKAATAAADATYGEATELFTNVGSAGALAEAQKNGGKAGRVYALYGRSLLGRAGGATTAPSDPKAAQYLIDAKAARDELMQESKTPVAMPAELVVAIAPTTAPATAPAATEPATAPAPGEAPPAPAPAAPGEAPAAPAAPTEPAPAPPPAAPPDVAPAPAPAPAAPTAPAPTPEPRAR